MPFGGLPLPSSSPSGGGGGEERAATSSNVPSSSPVPPLPSNFSANFTFQGPSVPQPRTFAPPSPGFSFPGPPSASPAPPRFPYPAPPPNPAPMYLNPMNSVPPNAGSIGTVSSMAPDDSRHAMSSGPPAISSQVRHLTPHSMQAPQRAIVASIQTQQVPVPPVTMHGQVSHPGQMASQGAIPVRPGPPPGPQYRAPFTANPALSMAPSGALGSAPAGVASRFPGTPFLPMVRPPAFPRAPTPFVRGPMGSMMRPAGHVRPLIPEKPQTVVYVGKIAPTVDDEFLRSVLELCGPVKSWKRAQEPTIGSFGFCEFESPEGVLRALRLLNGFSLEGRELKLTVTQAARDYLDRYIQKRKEKEQQLKQEVNAESEAESAPGVEVRDTLKQPHAVAPIEDQCMEEQGSDEKRFGIVNDEDSKVDENAKEKLAVLLEERAKDKPLQVASTSTLSDTAGKSTSMSDTQAKSRDGDSITDGGKFDGQDGTNEEGTSENKGNSEHHKPELSSSDRGKQFDNHADRDREKNRDRDRGRNRESRERDQKKDKEWEFDHMERERERNHARQERDKEMRRRDADRLYEDCEKVWEEREKEKERIRNVDRDKEKEREKQRRRLIKEQEEESNDEGWKKRRQRDVYGERKRVQREREDDEKDQVKEQEEIVEAKRRKLKEDYEEQVKKRLAETVQVEVVEVAEKSIETAEGDSIKPEAVDKAEVMKLESKEGHVATADGKEEEEITDNDDIVNAVVSMDVDEKCSTGPALKKLGFGLVGAGKRAALPSVFIQEDEEDGAKERGLRPLVPIEYTAEEMQAVSSFKPADIGSVTPNLAAAAEFAKSLLNLGTGTAKTELESGRDRGWRQKERSRDKTQWEDDRSKERSRDDDKERDRHRHMDGSRAKEQQPVKLDAKRLIDTIPKTKDDLFAYEIDWKIYDQHELHERMKPWIQKKITEFLGEEECSLVEFIVKHTKKHPSAESMLELLTEIIDDEAEMFVMKMWRMLIFEIKKVESEC